MLRLTALPQRYIDALGREELARICGQTESVVAMWIKRGKFPIDAMEKLLAFDPTPIHEIKPLYETTPIGGKLIILVPLAGPPAPAMMDCLMRLYDRREMAYERRAFNNLSVVRNSLAAHFLRGPWEYSWWQDGDSIVPCGDAAWFKRAAECPQMSDTFAGLHSIFRALVHKKTIVSVCYVSRHESATPQFGGGNLPASRQEVRQGPANRIKEVPWAGMGGMLVHRSVFEDIIRTQGAEITMKPGGIGDRFGYKYAFFNPLDLETCGDDVPMCERARRAGHKIFVDFALQAGHVGERAFTYKDTK